MLAIGIDGSVSLSSPPWDKLSYRGVKGSICDFSTWADGGIVRCNLTGAFPITDILSFWELCIKDEFFLRDSIEAWLFIMFVLLSEFKLMKWVG